jgi:hypothetical protein
MSLGQALFRQCSKPNGWLGRVNLWSMNRRHSKVTEWGLTPVGPSRTYPFRMGCSIS